MPPSSPLLRKTGSADQQSSSAGLGQSKLSQASRLARLQTPLGADALVLSDVQATERLGRLYTLQIEAVSEQDDIKPDALLGQTVAVEIDCPAGGKRYLHGHVNRFSHSPRSGDRYFGYQLTVVPWLWFLTRQADCRVFNQKSVPDILKDVFERRGFSGYEMDLHGSYTAWEYCVQYRETDFNFISRLMEQEGMYYYFKHTAGEHTMVIADSAAAHQTFPNYANVELRARGNTHGFNDELLTDWQNEHRHYTGTFAQTDYDFTRPRVDLATRNSYPGEFAQAAHEIYDYPGEYDKHGDGEDWARVRMEEMRVESLTYHTSGNVVGLATGHKFTLKGPPGFKDGGSYLITGTSIHIRSGVYETDAGEEDVYHIAATVIPAAEPFRAARVTPKPVIQGVQTAVVTGPKGEEIYTDKYGRVKVQFHWDREGKYDENTTCWVRVGHHAAGKRWGASFIPRIGQEVIVSFLEGDPDQPLIIGSVYNGEQMPPYLGGGLDPKHPNDKEVSGYKSNSTKGGQGYNEWRFTDTKGKEQIFLHAEKDMDTRVKNQSRTTIGSDTHLTIGSDSGGDLKGNWVIKVCRNVEFWVRRVMNLQVDDRYFLQVGDQGKYIEAKTKDGEHWVQSAKEYTYKTGKIVLEADEICLTSGANFIKLASDGIYINGTMVYINSGGSPGSAQDGNYTPPTEPDPADDSKSGSPSA